MREKIFPYLQSLLDKKLPFLALKKANENEVKIISQNNQILHKSVHDNLSYGVFSKFDNIDSQVYIINEEELNFKWSSAAVNSLHTTGIIAEDGKKEYLELFEKAMSELKKSNLKKVVLSRKQEFPKRDTDIEIFERLLDTYPTANGYFFYHPQVGKWMGATPELLLNVKGDAVSTMSLAGTALNVGKDTHIWGDKELEEQRLVTDFIKSQFVKTGITNIKESALETIEAGHLLHLCTLLAGTTHSGNIEELINSLHPTPAVCGLPRDKSKEFIMANENYDRSYYTGYLGIVKEDSSDYFVNLRCMQLFDKKVIIYVGGGVTVKSDVQLEYQETMAKLQTMFRLL
ncbi:MAG: chorismate-binding protein [Nonlabens sp.]|uniref:chorismate-binding protein n=1 Tax=Nonlabens sp. TaxID=1888209 RepID=UPI003EF909F7